MSHTAAARIYNWGEFFLCSETETNSKIPLLDTEEYAAWQLASPVRIVGARVGGWRRGSRMDGKGGED